MKRRTFLATSGLIVTSGVLAPHLGRDVLAQGGAPAVRARGDGPGSSSSSGRFPNVVLRTHEDRLVRFYDDLLKDKICLIDTVRTSECGYCAKQTANLARLRDMHSPLYYRFGRDVFMYTITSDPQHDTPEALARYAAHHGAGDGWLFLTGEPDDVERVRRALGLSNHPGLMVCGNEPFQRWTAWPARSRPDLITRYVIGMMPPTGGGDTKSGSLRSSAYCPVRT